MKNELKCKDCAYCWKEDDDRYPVCHWQSCCADDMPPCEEEPYWDCEIREILGDDDNWF